MLSYVFYSPVFICKRPNDTDYICSESVACSNPYGFYLDNYKHSFINEFHLYCNDHSKNVHGKSLIYLISALLTTPIVIISDYIGRLVAFYTAYFLIVFGSIICYFTSSYTFSIIGMGLTTTGLYSFFSAMYIYTSEITGKFIRRKIEKLF